MAQIHALLMIAPEALNADEIMEQLAFVKDWGCQFVVASPETKVVG